MSAYDFWLSDTITNHKTKTGFIRSLSTIENYINDLNQDGMYSDIYTALDVASVGMNPASVNDIYVKDNDETNNISRTELIKNYLSVHPVKENPLLHLIFKGKVWTKGLGRVCLRS